MIAANLIRGAFIIIVPLAVLCGWMHLGSALLSDVCDGVVEGRI